MLFRSTPTFETYRSGAGGVIDARSLLDVAGYKYRYKKRRKSTTNHLRSSFFSVSSVLYSALTCNDSKVPSTVLGLARVQIGLLCCATNTSRERKRRISIFHESGLIGKQIVSVFSPSSRSRYRTFCTSACIRVALPASFAHSPPSPFSWWSLDLQHSKGRSRNDTSASSKVIPQPEQQVHVEW